MKAFTTIYLVFISLSIVSLFVGCEEEAPAPPAQEEMAMPIDTLPIDSLPMDTILIDSTLLDVENGFYIQGEATSFDGAFSDLNRLRPARVEGFNNLYNSGTIPEEDRAGLLQTYAVLDANFAGFQIIQVVDTQTTIWGLDGVFETLDPNSNIDYPDGYVGVGDLTSLDPMPLTVPQEGLYQITIDISTGRVMAVDMTTMTIIGDGIGGWSDQEFVTADIDPNGMTWVFDNDGSGIQSTTQYGPYKIADGQYKFTDGKYKFRVAGGWKAPLSNEVVYASNGSPASQLLINTNFACNGGESSCSGMTNLIEGGGSLTIASSAFNRYFLTWSPGEEFSTYIEELGPVEPADFSNVSMSLIGSGVLIDGGDGNWDADSNSTLPNVDGNTYTYDFGSTLLRGGDGLGFRIREIANWELNFGYPQMNSITGDAASILTDSGGNFAVSIDGDFVISSMILTYNTETAEANLNINY